MAWQKNGTPDTLTGAGDTLLISNLTSLIFNQNMEHGLASGALDNVLLRLGNGSIDSGTNYAFRKSNDGGADSTNTSATGLTINGTNKAQDEFDISYIVNISAEEKLAIGFHMMGNTPGAANAPERKEWVGKWVNTSNQYDQISVNNGGTGDYAIGSNLSALGTD